MCFECTQLSAKPVVLCSMMHVMRRVWILRDRCCWASRLECLDSAALCTVLTQHEATVKPILSQGGALGVGQRFCLCLTSLSVSA
jgi:hypothetical protein